MSNNPFDMLYKRDVSFNLVILVVKQTTESAAVHKILKGEKCESVLTQVASSSQSTSAKRLNAACCHTILFTSSKKELDHSI